MLQSLLLVGWGLDAHAQKSGPSRDSSDPYPLNQTPHGFIESKGQWEALDNEDAASINYVLQRDGMSLWLLENRIAYQFIQYVYPDGYSALLSEVPSAERDLKLMELSAQIRTETYRVDLELIGAQTDGPVIATGRHRDHLNYYNRGVTMVSHFDTITYKNVYPGIDWRIFCSENSVKHEFVLAVGADASSIKMRYKHHSALDVQESGDLQVISPKGAIVEERPVSYQDQKVIMTQFKVDGDTVRFILDDYDRTRPLCIDPTLIWSTYYGGSGEDPGLAISTDQNGNVYMAGQAYFSSSLASGGHQNVSGGSQDLFLVKFNAAGDREWASYYGGSGYESNPGTATDMDGNIYLSGGTQSATMIADGGFITLFDGPSDAFLVKFAPDGQRIWSTYYGGESGEWGTSCKTTPSGDVFLTGYTGSETGMAYQGFQTAHGGGDYDAFLVRFSGNGDRIWATYYGGEEDEWGWDVAYGPNDEFFLVGWTESTSGISSSGHQALYGGGTYDCFVVKFNADGSRHWGTYLGGSDRDQATSCDVDSQGNLFLTGGTRSQGYFGLNGFQNSNSGGLYDAFLVKLNSSGSPQWMTFYGGLAYDWGSSCHVDQQDNVFLCGGTESTSGISYFGHQLYLVGEEDAFLTKFGNNGSRLWSTYFGGPGSDGAGACAVDLDGFAYITGSTNSLSSIGFNGFMMEYVGGDNDAFLTKFDGCASVGFLEETVCDSIVVGGTTFSTTGDHQAFLLNSIGCDSIVHISLTVNTTQSNASVEACQEFTWGVNGQTYDQDGVYQHIFQNVIGCDSIHILELTIHEPSFNSIEMVGCDSVILPDGGVYYHSGMYQATLQNSVGCDSIIQVATVVHHSMTQVETEAACDSLVWNGQTLTATGHYEAFYQTSNGCDSIVALDLTLHETTGAVAITECKVFVWNGQVYTESGIYSQTHPNALGCDSTTTLNLVITQSVLTSDPLDQTASIGSDVWFAVASGLTFPTFQWQKDEGSGFSDLMNGGQFAGVDAMTLGVSIVVVGNNGLEFRCIATSEACTDTSEVATLTVLGEIGIEESDELWGEVYPNPTTGDVRININRAFVNGEIVLIDPLGKHVTSIVLNGSSQAILSMVGLESGIYVLGIRDVNGIPIGQTHYVKVLKIGATSSQ